MRGAWLSWDGWPGLCGGIAGEAGCPPLRGRLVSEGLRCCVRLRVGVTGKGYAAGGPCMDPLEGCRDYSRLGHGGLQW